MLEGSILTDNDILEIANACYNKIESEIYTTKHKSPTSTLNRILCEFGFESHGVPSLYQFTNFLKGKYNIDINIEEIFILQAGVNVVLTDKREIILAYYKSIIRDIKLNQVLN